MTASPRLVEMSADLDQNVLIALVEMGAVNHTIIANNWDSAQELVAELGYHAPCDDLTTLWVRAEAECANRVRNYETNRERPAPTIMTAGPVPPAHGQIRRKLPSFTACSQRIARRKIATTPTEVHLAANTELEQSAKIAELIWTEAITHDTDTKRELDDMKGDKEGYKEIFIEHICTTSLQVLKQSLSSWGKWKDYCTTEDVCPTKASKTQLAMWLRTRKSGGKTAPRGALVSLKKMCDLIGVSIEAGHQLVKGQIACAKANEEQPATPLSINMWIWIEKSLTSENAFMRSIALAWTLLLNGTLRYAHLQRSSFVAARKSYVEFFAYAGKARTEGVRKPMKWVAPSITLTGTDLVKAIKDYMDGRGEELNKADFWLPDFGPPRKSLGEVDSFTGRPMPISRFMSLSTTFFSQGGVTPEEISEITTYSARRVLPTIADVIELTPTERVKIGAWKDRSGKLQQLRQRLQMPDRYSDRYLLTQAKAKGKAILAARMALDNMNHHGVAGPKTWDNILQQVPSARRLREALKEALD